MSAAAPACVSVVCVAGVGGDDHWSSDVLVERVQRALVSHFAGSAPADDEQNVLTVSNKYFTARVQVATTSDTNHDPTATATVQDGMILVFADDSMAPAPLDRLAQLHKAAAPGDLLRLCLGMVREKKQEPPARDSKAYEAEYARRVLWCLDRGYEYVPDVVLVESSDGMDKDNNDTVPTPAPCSLLREEKEGWARVVEAVEGTVWSSAVMKQNQQQQPSSVAVSTTPATPTTTTMTAAVPAAAASEKQSTSSSTTRENTAATTSSCLFLSETPQDQERHDRARQAILEQGGISIHNDNDAVAEDHSGSTPAQGSGSIAACSVEEEDHDQGTNGPAQEQLLQQQREQVKQERFFQQLQGSLEQAKEIRSRSVENKFSSDDERRQRAGDAAMALLNLMSSMDPSVEGDDDDDVDDDGSSSISSGAEDGSKQE